VIYLYKFLGPEIRDFFLNGSKKQLFGGKKMDKEKNRNVVPDIQRREFGFLFRSQKDEKPVMVRHIAFLSDMALWKFIEKRKPSDCFLSTAYYHNPLAKKMGDKGWEGADLFFDLDGDPDELFAVKGEATTIRYVLREDFDLDSQLIFSGCKGYHILVLTDDKGALKLGKDERREIIDYLKEKYHCTFIDEAASCDVHRLRRLPGTVNSKSGKTCEIVKR
jgi:DNA primase small subunit